MPHGLKIATLVASVVAFPVFITASVAAQTSTKKDHSGAAPTALTAIERTPEPEVVATAEAEPLTPPTHIDPGTHFVLEMNLGSSFSGSVGFAGSLVLGAGGKLKGFPLVFYLVGEAGYQRGGSDGQSTDGAYEDGRDYADFSIGLRTYVPIIPDVRLFLDLLPGATHASASLARDGFSDLSSSGFYAHFALGLGAQVRIFRELSAGVRAKVLFADDGLDDLREAIGIHTPVPIVVSGTITWHL
jgi:hypothetical protein